MPTEREVQIVEDLASRVLRSRHFRSKKGADVLGQTLKNFVKVYRDNRKRDLVSKVSATLEHRLREHLKQCFGTDRTFWRAPEQNALALRSADEGLALVKLSEVIDDAPSRFWLHQCARFEQPKTLITFSEPLFYYSRTLNAYIRFLDIDCEGELEGKEPELTDKAVNALSEKLVQASMGTQLAGHLGRDLIPVRHYVPAGDAFGGSAIRAWFRDKMKRDRWFAGNKKEQEKEKPPKRREAVRIADADHLYTNLIVLASRSSNPDLVYFRKRNPKLRYDLTPTGIRAGDRLLDDKPIAQGSTLAHVIVTNWLFGTDNVFTIVASNHSRAVGRICQLLVNDEELDKTMLVDKHGYIPARRQFAFEVEVNVNESHANFPKLLEPPVSYPLPARGAEA